MGVGLRAPRTYVSPAKALSRYNLHPECGPDMVLKWTWTGVEGRQIITPLRTP